MPHPKGNCRGGDLTDLWPGLRLQPAQMPHRTQERAEADRPTRASHCCRTSRLVDLAHQ